MNYTKIEEIRVNKNLSFGFMASELKVSVRYYIAIENGEIDLKLSTFFKIVEILGICSSDLLDLAEKHVSPSSN
jgi:predicted transcriptional regulator